MLLILISREDFFREEADLINELLDCGTFNFHLRKKTGSEIELRNLLKSIHPEFSHRIILHQEFNLVKEFNLGGIHLPEQQRGQFDELSQQGFKIVSTSIHRLNEFESQVENYSYLFYAPVFPSISKQGHQPIITISEIASTIKACSTTKRLIALGGINHQNFHQVLTAGFGGLALLGAVWQNEHPKKYLQDFITALNEASRK
jgi:thiamine-phosphate pyrophosphorylase